MSSENMDAVTTGLAILDGRTTRVLTSTDGLVLLENLSGSGPAGPAGPAGPPGDPVDTTQFYTKTNTTAILTLKQDNLIHTPGSGTVLFNNGLLRRLISGTGLTFTLDNNDNIILTATGSGAGGIDPTIATFTASQINL